MKIEIREKTNPKGNPHAFEAGEVLSTNDFLDPKAAEELFWGLYKDIQWEMVFTDKGQRARVPYEKLAGSDPAEIQAIRNQVFLSATKPGQYLYYSQALTPKKSCPSVENQIVRDVSEFLASDPFLDSLGHLTGLKNISLAQTEISLYQGFCFASGRSGRDIETGVNGVFTLDLTKEWFPSWGGYLHFPSPEGNVENSLFPGFNNLHVFSANKVYSIGYVPPFCNGVRLAINGVF